MSGSSNDLNTALESFVVPVRSKRAQAEAERRAKRRMVSNVRGYRGTEKATGQEPAWNRPSLEDWAPTNVAKRSLSDRAPFATALSGYDPDRVLLEGYEPWTVP